MRTHLVSCATLACSVAALLFQILINRKASRIMAQIDDLNTSFDTLYTKLDTLESDVDTVLAELQTANANPAVDLTATIAKVQAISGKLTTITDEFPAATPAPATPVGAVHANSWKVGIKEMKPRTYACASLAPAPTTTA